MKKQHPNLSYKLVLLLSIPIVFSQCSSVEELSSSSPAWQGVPSPVVYEGVAGRYRFPGLKKGEPASMCNCALVSGDLPTGVSLSKDCVLSWPSTVVPGEAPGLVIQADNGVGSATSVPFIFKVSPATGSQVVFRETFDDQPDWSQRDRCIFDNASSACNTLPSGWDYYYEDDKNPTHDAGYIEAAAARGGIGKGFHLWDESRGKKGQWKSEAQLAKRLPQAYQDLWFSFWLRFNPEAQWQGGSRAAKVLRAGAYNPQVMDGTAGTSLFNTNGSNAQNRELGRTTGGMFFVDVVHESKGRSNIRLVARCNATYNCGSRSRWTWFYVINPDLPAGTQDWNDTFGDGNWHKIEVHAVMNSLPGVDDGVLEVYYDGTRLGGRDNIPFKMDNAESWIEGINLFSIAGNADNVWAGNVDTTESPEQSFYYLDDIQVCTSRCP